MTGVIRAAAAAFVGLLAVGLSGPASAGGTGGPAFAPEVTATARWVVWSADEQDPDSLAWGTGLRFCTRRAALSRTCPDWSFAKLGRVDARPVGFFAPPRATWSVVVMLWSTSTRTWTLQRSLMPFNPTCPACVADFPSPDTNVRSMLSRGWVVRAAWGLASGGVKAIVARPGHAGRRLIVWNAAGTVVRNVAVSRAPRAVPIAISGLSSRTLRGVTVSQPDGDTALGYGTRSFFSATRGSIGAVLPGPLG